jgi:hypothetical protein
MVAGRLPIFPTRIGYAVLPHAAFLAPAPPVVARDLPRYQFANPQGHLG